MYEVDVKTDCFK